MCFITLLTSHQARPGFHGNAYRLTVSTSNNRGCGSAQNTDRIRWTSTTTTTTGPFPTVGVSTEDKEHQRDQSDASVLKCQIAPLERSIDCFRLQPIDSDNLGPRPWFSCGLIVPGVLLTYVVTSKRDAPPPIFDAAARTVSAVK